MDWATWAGGLLPTAGAVGNALGVGLLAFLFANDRILTRGQHERRTSDKQAAHDLIVANLKDAHELALRELTGHYATLSGVKDLAYSEVKESRDYYRAARIEERDRADKVTDQLAESTELGKLATHLLASMNSLATEDKPR